MIGLRKIIAPALPPIIYHREQLLSVLGETLGVKTTKNSPAFYQLILLCTPAGYGKTTLLIDTVERFSLTCCWYFLDRSDQDISLFIKNVLASIRQHYPSFGSQLDTLLAENIDRDEKTIQIFMDMLLHSLADDMPERLILILCNYQEVNGNAAINRFINAFLKSLPPHCQLVIESRVLPDLELTTLIAEQKMFGLGCHDLQFSVHEVYAFAQAKGVSAFSEVEAELITTTFDGWITGILLGSRIGSIHFPKLLSPREERGALLTQPIDRQRLLTYVVSEVFRHEEIIYTFLKETSLLDRLVPSFCDILLKTSNAAVLLEYAERQGLFVTCSCESGKLIYRCHSLLRELLQEELRRKDEERYRRLHQQLAVLLYQTHMYQAALGYALEVQEYNVITQILLEGTPTLLDQGQSDLVLRCLEYLPATIVQSSPSLLLIQVNTYLRRGDFASAQSVFEQVEQMITVLGVSEHQVTHAELIIVRGELFLQKGDHRQALEQFQQVLTCIPTDERVLRIRTHQQLGISMVLSGQPLHEGIVQFQQALGLCHPLMDERLAGELHHQLANVYGWAGNYVIAEHHRQRIRVIQERLGQPYFLINNLTGLGLLKMRRGYGEEAEMFFQTLLDLAHQSPRLISSKAYALLGIGELEWTRQHFKEALIYLEEAHSLALQLKDRYLHNSILNMRALVYLRIGDLYTAQYFQEQVSLHSGETRSYESVFSLLVQGTLRLAQQRYDDAQMLLEKVIYLTSEIGIQWLQVQALIRLAACFLAQGNQIQAKNVLQQAILLNIKSEHDYILQVEIQAYPMLQPLIQERDQQIHQTEVTISVTERLHILALGEPTVLIDASPVTRWRMARAMELFFFLLECDQSLRKDQIIDALWPEPDDIERVNQTFRSTIYYLRQVVGNACLLQQSGLYRLDLRAIYGQFQYDVALFKEQQRIAKIALEEEEDESAAQAFQQMVNLYRGDYVQAFYSNWCMLRRDELRTSFIEAHQQLALIAWRSNEWDKSLLHWQHLLTLDPCLEKAHYGVMRCYHKQGKRDLALRQYRRCSKELREQLGTEPDLSLQKLYQRLSSGTVKIQ